MHGITFLQDLAVVLIVAGLVTLLFHRLKQPVVLGYILAGVIIGPHTPPFPLIQNEESIRTFADLGIIFLIFSLGLEFNLRRLRQVGLPAFFAAVIEILLMTGVGYGIGQFFGWSRMDSVFLGAILAISSTTIIVKALSELGLRKERFAELIFGILIIEDILAIVMIALLSGIAMTGSLDTADVGLTIGRLLIFLATVLVAGLLAVPRLLGYVARFKSNEMLLVTVLGLCFGFALLAVKLGYSVALGAFVIGAVMAESRELGKIEHLTEPLRDMFSAVFFVAIGMMIDLNMMVEYAWPIVVLTVAVIFGKVLTCSLGTFMAGVDARTSLRVGMGLAQIGEFSFIIAALGLSLDVTSHFLYPIAVAVSALTTLTTPYLIKSADGLVTFVGRVTPSSILGMLEFYTRWATSVRLASPRYPQLRLVRSVVWQLIINMLLIAGMFLIAAFAARYVSEPLPLFGKIPGGFRTACWTIAVVVTLPIYVATARKGRALGMMLAEISVSGAEANSRLQMLRTMIANVFLVAGLLVLGIMTLLLSSTILPPGPTLIVLLITVALAVIFFGTYFNRLYSRAKFALVETWSQPPAVQEPTPPMLTLLQEAQLKNIEIKKGTSAAGKLIRELQLRTQTGASIIALERDKKTIINPGPDDELLVGDIVLLLGHPEQLKVATQFITQPVAP